MREALKDTIEMIDHRRGDLHNSMCLQSFKDFPEFLVAEFEKKYRSVNLTTFIEMLIIGINDTINRVDHINLYNKSFEDLVDSFDADFTSNEDSDEPKSKRRRLNTA